MSMFPVERKKIIEITEEIIEAVKQKRHQYYETAIADILKKHKNKKTFFFKKKSMSRKDAETELWQSWSIWDTYRPSYISYGKEREERASKLLNACKITTEKVIQLDTDDAAFLNEWQRNGRWSLV